MRRLSATSAGVVFLVVYPAQRRVGRIRHRVHRLLTLLLLSVLVLVFSSVLAFSQAPVLSSISPTAVSPGMQLTLTGSGFGASQGSGLVSFGNDAYGTVVSWSATQIVATVPTARLTPGNVTVRQNGVYSNGVAFTVIPPVLSSISPTAVSPGMQLTLTGSGFGASQGSGLVSFGDDAYGTVVSWGATQIVTTVPTAGLTPGNVSVRQNGVYSNGVAFTVIPPVLSSISPTAVSPGMQLTLTGSGFGASQGSGLVYFGNGADGTVVSWSATQIVTTVPTAGLMPGQITVRQSGVYSNGVAFTVIPPVLSSISPTAISPGMQLTLTGSGFGPTVGSGGVYFGYGEYGTVVSWSSTQVVVTVPIGISPGPLFVYQNGANSNTLAYTTIPPVLTSISPTAVTPGMQMTLTGSGFGSTVSNGEAYFGYGKHGTVVSWSSTQIVVTVPSGIASGSVEVIQSGTASNLIAYTVVPAPNIASLSPTSGTAGTVVTISGSNLGNGQSAAVTFNGVAATPTGWTNTSITVPVPSTAASGNVLVTIGGLSSNGNVFTVVPSITSISPTSGVIGSAVTITGTSFGSSQGASTVTVNGTAATPTNWTSSSITVPLPSGATTGNVVVIAGGVTSNGVNFTVVPNITSLSPTLGAVGTSVTIGGTSFGSSQGASTVTFNGTTAAPNSWAASSITVPVPVGAATGNVVVTVGGVASNGVSFTVPVAFVATTGQMGASRYGQTATQLTTGQVLVAGGQSTSGVLNSAELYSLSSQTFAAANAMNVARWLHTATLLNDGTVLIAGGSSTSGGTTLDSAEIYDPVAGTFTLLPNTLNTARVGHTATLLSNGQVLIVGGYDPTTGIIADAELYDPTAQVFIDLGNTNAPRFHHTATLLQNGQVLITGGETDPTPSGAYNTAEIFNPTTWNFTALSVNMTTAREGHAATLLNNGQVLITGGDLPGSGSLNTAEIYNSTSNTFTAVSSAMTNPRIYHDAILLNGGKVLLSGGETDSAGNSTSLNTAELYDPISQTFTTVVGNMTSLREHQTATLLNDGTVLEDGGTDGTNIFNTAEIYTTSKLVGLTSITISPATPSVPLGAQQQLVATGTFGDGSTQVLSSALWSSSSTNVFGTSNDATDSGFATSTGLGSATVTATATGVSGSTTITVPAPTLTSITLLPQSPALPMGTSQQFTATGVYSDGSFQDLTSTATWTSSSGQATVNTTGLVAGISLGNSTIQASLGSQSASTLVTVGPPALVGLSLTPSTATIALGVTQQYQATGTYSDGSTQNLTNSATWFSVPQSFCVISASGSATGVGQGTAGITATVGTLSAISTLVVGAPGLVSIAVVPSAANIPLGSQQQFVATGTYSDGTTQDLTASLTWASSNTSAASISGTGFATPVAAGNSTITASSGPISGAAALTVGGSSIGLQTSRYQHNATLLNSGAVLIAGGINCPSANSCTYLSSAELYSPTTGTIASTGTMATARSAPSVLLGNGKVLVAGGLNCDSSGNCASLQSAEIYDPSSGTFSSAGNMTVARDSHTVTLLNNGKALIAGGETCTSATSCTTLNTAELYDPTAGTFTATVALNSARFDASAVALSSGQVLIAGGFNGTTYPAQGELYDPVAGTFTLSGSLNIPRAFATATLLDNGYVLISGGSTCSSPSCPIAGAELYASGVFSTANSMNVTRLDQTATLLTNGQVLMAGGYDGCTPSCVSDATTELYNPVSGSFTSGQGLTTGRSGQTATLLTDGSVLLVGGINAGLTLSSTDSYQPASLALPQLASIAISPSNNTLTPGTNLPLVASGYDSSGFLIGTLQSVVWNSSAPSVATVSNSAGSAGIVASLTPGTTTITASVGTVSASTQVTVTVPLVSLSVSPTNESILLNSPQGAQLTATGVYSDGSSSNLTASATWTTSNSLVAAILQSSTAQGIVVPVGAGTANVTASFGGISASTSITVVAPPVTSPVVSGISPASGAAGTQVTVSGSGFGATQGNGTVVLGSVFGAVVSWSDTQVVATVVNGSQSGIALVQQGGTESNSLSFTVNNASITSVSPTSGLAGTQVTITGSGFGVSQGGSTVWLGTAPGTVTSWSDGQVVANVAPNSASGSAQVLENGVWSNAVNFTINTPHITGISPNSGGAGTVVTINGSGFGTSQGSGNVWIGSTYGSVVGWSDTQVVASVSSNAVTGIVKIDQDATWSNAVTFTVPVTLGGGTSVTIVPNLISMVVGDTRSLQALDSNSQPVTGLTWASSDTTIATLSTDDPPIITAVGAGKVTITAGSGSADLTVFQGPTLPLGTTIWSNPGDGSGVSSIVPAVPSSTGVADVFAVQGDGNVQAITSDGRAAWTANVGTQGNSALNSMVPDFQGGLIIVNPGVAQLNGQTWVSPGSVQRLDGMTGNSVFTYNIPNTYVNGLGSIPPPVAVHTDGTIFTINGDTLVGLNPLTGTQKFSFPMPHRTSTTTITNGSCASSSADVPPTIGGLMIAGDGYAYLVYQYGSYASVVSGGNCGYFSNVTTHTENHARLLRVGTDGSSTEISVGDWSSDFTSTWTPGENIQTQSGYVPGVTPFLITNADQGVFLSLIIGVPVYYTYFDAQYIFNCAYPNCSEEQIVAANLAPYANFTKLLTVTAGSVTSNVTLPSQISLLQPILQAQDGTFFGIVDYDWSGDDFLAKFDKNGNIKWSVDGYYAQIATSDGGVIAQSYSGQSYKFDANGNSTSQTATLNPPSSGSRTGQWPGWLANLSASSYSIASRAATSLASALINYTPTFAALVGGNNSGQGTAIQQVQTNQTQGYAKQLPDFTLPALCYPPTGLVGLVALIPTCGNINAIELLTNKSPAYIFQHYIQTFAPVADVPSAPSLPAKPNGEMYFDNPSNPGAPINVTIPGQILKITLKGFAQGIAAKVQPPFLVMTERVDTTNNVISAVTLQGHPLAGWRYWRVYSIGTNDVVIETGAYDQPGPGLKNYAGYYVALLDGAISGGWQQYMQFIQKDLAAPPGSNLNGALGGIKLRKYPWPDGPLVKGYWDYFGDFTDYILNNVCQSSSCN